MSKENEAKKLIEEIKATGFTQIQIAEEILVSPVTVSRWKSGEIEIPDGKLLALRGIILRAADAEVIKAAEELAEAASWVEGAAPLGDYSQPQVSMGLEVVTDILTALAAFRQAQQARAEKGGE